jgi:hypothetical protein
VTLHRYGKHRARHTRRLTSEPASRTQLSPARPN